MTPNPSAGVLSEPVLLQEGGLWLVLVPGHSGTVQTYECDSELQARELVRLFTRSRRGRRHGP